MTRRFALFSPTLSGLDSLFAKLLGKPSTLLMAQVRMAFPVAVLSAFLNNTPIVALLVPLIFAWSKSAPSIHAQKLLIPLSYASILGGTCTLIGTSTNLVIAGLQVGHSTSPFPSLLSTLLCLSSPVYNNSTTFPPLPPRLSERRSIPTSPSSACLTSPYTVCPT